MGKLKRDFFLKYLPKFMAKKDMAPPKCDTRDLLSAPQSITRPGRQTGSPNVNVAETHHLSVSLEVTSERLLDPCAHALSQLPVVRVTGCSTLCFPEVTGKTFA